MADKNNKYFFRQDIIDADIGAVTGVPPDVEWAVLTKKPAVPTARNGSQAGNDEGGGIIDLEDFPVFVAGPEVPQIMGIKKQEVTQDPQGNSAISVTFVVSDISGVEYEMRFTRG